jgi:hypothetical protein
MYYHLTRLLHFVSNNKKFFRVLYPMIPPGKYLSAWFAHQPFIERNGDFPLTLPNDRLAFIIAKLDRGVAQTG